MSYLNNVVAVELLKLSLELRSPNFKLQKVNFLVIFRGKKYITFLNYMIFEEARDFYAFGDDSVAIEGFKYFYPKDKSILEGLSLYCKERCKCDDLVIKDNDITILKVSDIFEKYKNKEV